MPRICFSHEIYLEYGLELPNKSSFEILKILVPLSSVAFLQRKFYANFKLFKREKEGFYRLYMIW